jgi:hypothetical protein
MLVTTFPGLFANGTRVAALTSAGYLGSTSQDFRHVYKMARQLGLSIRGEWRYASLFVAFTPIERRQFLAQIDNPQIHEVATSVAAIILGRLHEPRTKPAALSRWIHGQQSDVGPFCSRLHINASRDAPAVLRQDELALAGQRAQVLNAYPIAVDKEPLNLKSRVDQASDGFEVGGIGEREEPRC